MNPSTIKLIFGVVLAIGSQLLLSRATRRN
jgi:hypothetical protein